MPEPRQCEHCKQLFTPDIYHAKAVYCSHTCRLFRYNITLECTQCHKLFQRKKYKNKGQRPFCSPTCRSQGIEKRITPLWFPPNDIQLGYIAGVLDGEGYVTITKGGKKGIPLACVSIGNTCKEIIEHIGANFGLQHYIIPYTPKNHKHKQSWTFKVQHQWAISFLTPLIPYLIVKQKQAMLAVAFHKLSAYERRWPQQGQEYYKAMRQLNARGLHSNI